MKKSTLVIVLFNLKKETSIEEYEEFAKNIDAPTIQRQPSNKSFKILKTVGLVGSDEKPPYQYIEVMEVTSFDELMKDVQTNEVAEILKTFNGFAEDPKLILTEQISD